MTRRFWKNRLLRTRFREPTQVLPWITYWGFKIRVINVHSYGPHKYEWEMIPVSPRAIAICEGKRLLRDPTSWTDAKWARKMAKYDARDAKPRKGFY